MSAYEIAEAETKNYNLTLDRLRFTFEVNYNRGNTPSTSDKLDEYERLYTLGSGAFAVVYLVKHKTNKTYHAMKVSRKKELLTKSPKQTGRIVMEKNLLRSIQYPFIIKLEATFKDSSYLYFLMPFIPGGDLFNQLKRMKKFDENLAKFYAVQVLLAIEFLHYCNIIYRDLKPENILVDVDGYLKLADMGFGKKINGRTYSFCGTLEYMSPEMILNKGYGLAVDWWAFGVLCYEMIAGVAPFTGNPRKIFEKVTKGSFTFTSEFSTSAKDLIINLLQTDLTKRYGNLKSGTADIKMHAWFSEVNFTKIYKHEAIAPYIPIISGPGDTSHFEDAQSNKLWNGKEDSDTKLEFADF